jgi:hypothetical protein
MNNVTLEKLESKFPGEGESRFRKIAELGGYGHVSPSALDKSLEGGLDIQSALDDSNTSLTTAKKDKIRELAGLTSETSDEAPTKKTTKEGK